jgi:hypothetical protein
LHTKKGLAVLAIITIVSLLQLWMNLESSQLLCSPMVNGIGNNKATSDEVHNYNQGSDEKTDVGISHFEIGHLGMFIIC